MADATHPLGGRQQHQSGEQPKKKAYLPGDELDDGLNSKPLTKSKQNKENKGWFGGFFGKRNRPKEMILPDDKNPTICGTL